MSMSVNPVIAIVMGDPAGIGPELIVKVLAEDKLHQRCRPFIIGDLPVMRATAAGLGCSLRFRAIQDLAAASFDPGNIDVLNPPGFALGAPRRQRSIPNSARRRHVISSWRINSPCNPASMAS